MIIRRALLVLMFSVTVTIGGAFGLAADTDLDGADGEVRAWPLYDPCSANAESGEGVQLAIGQLKHPQKAERIAAIDRLARLCARDAIDPLLESLADEDPEVRAAAIRALGPLRYSQAADARLAGMIERLIPLATDGDWRIRLALSRTLASFQVYPASNAVLNLIANPGTRPVVEAGDLRARCEAILMVNQLRDVRFSRKAISFLMTFVDHEDPVLRSIALGAVGELKSTRNGYHELVAIARKAGVPQQRIRAIEWLLQWRATQALPLFEGIAETEAHPQVREAALRALAGLKAGPGAGPNG